MMRHLCELGTHGRGMGHPYGVLHHPLTTFSPHQSLQDTEELYIVGPNQAAPVTAYSGSGTPAIQGVSFLNRSFLFFCRFRALASKAQGTTGVEEIKPIKCSPHCGSLRVLSCPQSMMLTHTNRGRPCFCQPLCTSLSDIVRLWGMERPSQV